MRLQLVLYCVFYSIRLVSIAIYIDDKKINILGLFGPDEKEEEFSFQKTMTEINEDFYHHYAFQLVPQTEELLPYDSFNISKTICRRTSRGDGIGAIFGPDFDEITGIVQSISDALEIPHIDTRWDTLSLNASHFYINLYPDSALLAKAIYQVLDDMDWESFTLIYDSKESLVHVQEVLKFKMGRTSYDRPAITMKELPEKQKHYKPFLKEIKNSLETRILLHCAPDKIMNILRKAKEVNLMGTYQSFFITSLDAHTIDYEEFKSGRTNITMLRLINPENPLVYQFVHQRNLISDWEPSLRFNEISIKTDTALMRDAVLLYAETIQPMIRNVSTKPIECSEEPDIWPPGYDIAENMKAKEFEGMSGLMRFDRNTGKRIFFKLDVIQLVPFGFRTLGSWDPENGMRHKRNISQLLEESFLKIENKTLRVVTKTGEPYIKILSNDTSLGNNRFDGYSKNLLDDLAARLRFNYTLELVEGDTYGKLDEKTGKWDGLIGELRELRADMAICDFTITYEREKVIDFTHPFMTLGISILHSRPPAEEPSYFSFLDPFNFVVWSYLATCYLGISIALFVIARCTPYEWEAPHPCDQEPEELENAWSLRNCLWFSLGSVLQQGCDILPKAWSTRLTAAMWWFFTMIVTSTYTANLAAFMTTKRMELPIKDIKDLAEQDKIKYGCYINGSTANFFRNSNDSLYQRMWATMESANPSVFTGGNKEGVQRVLRSRHKYAFFMESSTIEYEKNRNCDLVQVGGQLDSKKYGIALPQNSHYKEALDIALQKFQEEGHLFELKKRWWKREDGKECEEVTDEDKDKLQVSTVGGVFVLLILGCVLAFFVSILEFLWNVRKVAVREKITLSEAFWLELKFAFQCRGTTKPVRHTPQSGMIGTPLNISQIGFDKCVNKK